MTALYRIWALRTGRSMFTSEGEVARGLSPALSPRNAPIPLSCTLGCARRLRAIAEHAPSTTNSEDLRGMHAGPL